MMSKLKHVLFSDYVAEVVETVEEPDTAAVNRGDADDDNFIDASPLPHLPDTAVAEVSVTTNEVVSPSVDIEETVVAKTVVEIPPSLVDMRPLSEDKYETLFCDGYDSDGLMPIEYDLGEDMKKLEVYNDTVVGLDGVRLEEMATTMVDNGGGDGVGDTFVLLTEAEIKGFKVDTLRKELKSRGLHVTGKKAELVERLEKAMVDKVCVAVTRNSEPASTNVFTPGTRWITLTPLDETLDDPNDGSAFHAPTPNFPGVNIRTENAAPKKRNYGETFDRPPFVATVDIDELDSFKRRKLDPRTKKVQTKSVRVEDTGMPKPAFLRKHGLDCDSLPHEWFEVFLPKTLTSLWTTYTNTKALLANAGQKGEIYPDFKPFTPTELRKHIGVYFVHGLSPSPHVNQKFQSQADNPMNGNDFVKSCLGPNATRRHKHFKHFLAVQDPLQINPSREQYPNWKVEPLLIWMKKVSMEAWKCGRIISVDEQTIGFQGRHGAKLRITYKREGDGFQCDALCDDGYTYTFYFRHQPAPEKYLKNCRLCILV